MREECYPLRHQWSKSSLSGEVSSGTFHAFGRSDPDPRNERSIIAKGEPGSCGYLRTLVAVGGADHPYDRPVPYIGFIAAPYTFPGRAKMVAS